MCVKTFQFQKYPNHLQIFWLCSLKTIQISLKSHDHGYLKSPFHLRECWPKSKITYCPKTIRFDSYLFPWKKNDASHLRPKLYHFKMILLITRHQGGIPFTIEFLDLKQMSHGQNKKKTKEKKKEQRKILIIPLCI